MQRISTSLVNAGFDVLLVGRKLPSSKALRDFPFRQKRLYCFFKKGKLFYLEYNIRLFIFLLFARFDIMCSIDLDTILPGFYISKIRKKTFVYDAHEYFTEVPEVVGRPRVQRIWQRIAKLTIPRTLHAYTVCDSLSEIFEKEYGTPFKVIRNAPVPPDFNTKNDRWKTDKPIILYQGALNEGRGLEEYLQAMQHIDNAELWLAGEGDLSAELRAMAAELKVSDRVRFLGYVEPADLRDLTPQASIGLNMLRNKGLSYYYSLSNKFLDYIQAGVPSINADFPEYQNIISQYKVGLLVDDLDPIKIAQAIQELLNNKALYQQIKAACKEAAKVYVWAEEERKLIEFYKDLEDRGERRDHFVERRETHTITNHQSPITNHQSPVINHQSPITNHQSPVINHQSPITNHQSPVTNHQSPITNPQSLSSGSFSSSENENHQSPTPQHINTPTHQHPNTPTHQHPTTSTHLISFNIPYPANYGGVISVFYHLKALHQLGAKIILHCYEYGREHSEELEKYCEQVYYYKRNMSPVGLLNCKPFIVQSRQHPGLLKNLLKNDAPILFEGTHTCALLAHPQLKNRLKIVRMHNVETQYYANLAGMETKPLKRLYFQSESRKLKRFEEKTVLKHADHILAISPDDTTWFKRNFDAVHYVPAFHPNETVDIIPGKGKYVLFHGDLSVKDNVKAAFYLIENVFKENSIPFIIVGLNPPDKLEVEVAKYSHIQLKANVPQIEMEQLIQEAHINLLYTFHAAGMKLKLLNALYRGRFCLLNSLMVQNTGMQYLCHIADNPEKMRGEVNRLMGLPFGKEDIIIRRNLLETKFSNIENAKVTFKLIQY